MDFCVEMDLMYVVIKINYVSSDYYKIIKYVSKS